MFTWICPQCGREVPPAYTECPDCAAKAKGASQPQPPAGDRAAPAPPLQGAPPPPQGPPQGPQQAGPGAPPPYNPQTGQFYPPPPYPPQQYQQPYPPYPPQQYPPQAYQGQGAPYPPQQYPPQYGAPQYPAQGPYPSQPYAPSEQPVPVEPMTPRSGSTLFGSAPPEPPAHAPAPRTDAGPAPAAPSSESSHEPGAPRAGGMLFGASAPAEPPKRGGLPTWLMAVLFAGGGIALIAGIYALVGSSHGTSKPSTTVESPAAKPGAPTNVWQKFIEVSGVRFGENAKKQPVVKFVLTNHATEDVDRLAGNVTLWARTPKSEEEAAGTFTFATSLGSLATKEMEAPLTTKLKMYELPDWQYLSTDLQITAPGGAQPAAAK